MGSFGTLHLVRLVLTILHVLCVGAVFGILINEASYHDTMEGVPVFLANGGVFVYLLLKCRGVAFLRASRTFHILFSFCLALNCAFIAFSLRDYDNLNISSPDGSNGLTVLVSFYLVPVAFALQSARIAAECFTLEHGAASLASTDSLIFLEITLKLFVDYYDIAIFITGAVTRLFETIEEDNRTKIFEYIQFSSVLFVIASYFGMAWCTPKNHRRPYDHGTGPEWALDCYIMIRHTAFFTAIFLDVPFLVIRMLNIALLDWMVSPWLIKNILSIAFLAMIRFQATRLEFFFLQSGKDKLVSAGEGNLEKSDSEEAKVTEDTPDGMLQNGSFGLLYEAARLGLTNSSDTKYQLAAEPLLPIEDEHAQLAQIEGMASDVMSSRRLPVRGFSAFVVLRKAWQLPWGGGIGESGSSMLIDSEALINASGHHTAALLAFVITSLVAPIGLILSVAVSYRVAVEPAYLTPWITYMSGHYYPWIKTPAPVFSASIVVAQAFINAFTLTVLGPFPAAIIQMIFVVLKQVSLYFFIRSILWTRLFEFTFDITSESGGFEIHTQGFWYVFFFFTLPYYIRLLSVSKPAYELFFGRSGINYTQEMVSRSMAAKQRELLLNSTFVAPQTELLVFCNISTHMALLFYATRYMLCPSMASYLLMGPNRIKSVRVADQLNFHHGVLFWTKLITRIFSIMLIWDPIVASIYVLDIIVTFYYMASSQSYRRSGMFTTEVQYLFNLAIVINEEISDIDEPPVLFEAHSFGRKESNSYNAFDNLRSAEDDSPERSPTQSSSMRTPLESEPSLDLKSLWRSTHEEYISSKDNSPTKIQPKDSANYWPSHFIRKMYATRLSVEASGTQGVLWGWSIFS